MGDLRAACAQIAVGMFALMLRRRGIPAARGVVVMGAGVDDRVLLEVVRQKGVFGGVGKRELKDAHAGQAEAGPQRHGLAPRARLRLDVHRPVLILDRHRPGRVRHVH